MSTRPTLVLAGVLLAGCGHAHGEHNAPGRIDPRLPPRDLGSPRVERPDDPGERMLAVTAGPFFGGGTTLGTPEGARGSLSAGVEASVHAGTSPRSHAADDFFVYPASAVGANVGFTLLSRDRAAPTVGYMEVQYYETGMGVAAGWAWDPHARSSGPQTTIFFGPFYLRGDYLIHDRTVLEAGLIVKIPYVWVESQ